MAGIPIGLAESALGDLEEIRAWYADQGVADVGDQFVEQVFRRVQALAVHPDLGRVVPEFDQPFLRELIHPPFRIVYRRHARRISIVRVWRSERLLRLDPPPAQERSPDRDHHEG